jgi:hypothetical protein
VEALFLDAIAAPEQSTDQLVGAPQPHGARTALVDADEGVAVLLVL